MPGETYTHGHPASVLRAHGARTAEDSAGYLLERLQPGQRLLDVGCGPATITLGLAQRVAPGEVVAVDAAQAAIDAASANIAQAERAGDVGAGQVTARTADAYALPFDDDSFDVVHAHQVLQHLARPIDALAEWRRVCRPGGIVAVRDADYAAMTWWPATAELERWLALYRLAATANGGEPDAGRRLLSWALAAGFDADGIEPSAGTWCYATAATRARWASTWAERTTSTVLAEQLVTGGLATQDELDAIGASWLRWAAHDDAWFIVPNGELLCRA